MQSLCQMTVSLLSSLIAPHLIWPNFQSLLDGNVEPGKVGWQHLLTSFLSTEHPAQGANGLRSACLELVRCKGGWQVQGVHPHTVAGHPSWPGRHILLQSQVIGSPAPRRGHGATVLAGKLLGKLRPYEGSLEQPGSKQMEDG